MNAMKIKLITLLIMLLPAAMGLKVSAAEYKHDIYVNQDGSGDYTTITEALEGIRAYMDYTVTVHIANGTYKEKIIIPSWLKNVSFIGEDPEKTVITFDHHANIDKMGTFRTYTVRVDANDVLFKNLTIENNAPQLGQAVALHTEGDKIRFVNCRFLGNQDTIFTGGKTRASTSPTATSKGQPTSSSVRRQPISRTATFSASVIPISQPPRLPAMSDSATYSTAASSALPTM